MKLFGVFSILLIILNFVVAEEQGKEQETASSAKVETNAPAASDKVSNEPVKETDDDSGRQKKSYLPLQSGKPIYGDPIPLKVNGGSEYASVSKPINYAEHLSLPVKQTLNYGEAVPLHLGYGEQHLNYGEHLLDYGKPLVDYGSHQQQHYNYYGVPQPQQLHYGGESIPFLNNYGDSILSQPHLPSYKPSSAPVPAPAPLQYKPPQVPATYKPPPAVPAAYKPPLLGPVYKPTYQVQPQKQPQLYQVQHHQHQQQQQQQKHQQVYRQPLYDYYQTMNVYDTAQSVYAPPAVAYIPSYGSTSSSPCVGVGVSCAPTVQLVPCQGGYGGYGSGYKVGGYGYGGSY